MTPAPRLRCPRCGGRPVETDTRYGLRLDCCDLWAWGRHPLANRETHEARKAAHVAFDPLWRGGSMSRTEAYQMLAAELGMTSEQCHMKRMTVEEALRVPEAAARIANKINRSNCHDA